MKTWDIYTIEYYSAIKKEWNNVLSGIWVDLKIVILNYVSQKEEDKYHDTSYM